MKLSIVVPALFVCLAATPALAQEVAVPTQAAPEPASMVQKLFRADSKVAFVDLQRVFSESDYGKRGMAQVAALQRTLTDGLNVRARDAQELAEKIKTQQNVVAPEVWLAWNTDLSRMQREAQFAEQEAQIQVDQFQQRLLASFEDVVRPVIESVRVKRDLWAVFSLQPSPDSPGALSLIAADPAIDVSTEVVALLNQKRQ